jgi:hypothetical protein
MQPTTNINIPASDAIVFKIAPIHTPEGWMRVTLWRNYAATDPVSFNVDTKNWDVGSVINGVPTLYSSLIGSPKSRENTIISLSNRIVTLWPVPDEETENYFSEGTIHEFSMGIYNTNSLADFIQSIDTSQGNQFLCGNNSIATGSLQLGPNSDDRLLFRYLTAPPSPISYFPLPQIQATGTDGVLNNNGPIAVFNSVSTVFTPAMIGWQICEATTHTDGTTVPAGVYTILGLVAETPCHSVYISSKQGTSAGGGIWALMAPPFALVNQNTSIFGNDGTIDGSGHLFTDTMSNGGSSFAGLLEDAQLVKSGQVQILINFQPVQVVDVISNQTMKLGGLPIVGGPFYWQIIYERVGYFQTPLYALVEFQQDNEANYTTMLVGQAQAAMTGDDKRWIHAQSGNPILDEDYSASGNAPLDAEQIWELRFIHAITSGLSQLPITPATVVTDNSSWYMPSMLMGDQATQGTGALIVPPSPFNIIPCVANALSDGAFAPYSSNGIWSGHIDIVYALTLMMDAALGVGGWTITSDDSPIEIEGALLQVKNNAPPIPLYNGNEGNLVGQRESGNWTTGRTTAPDVNGNYPPLKFMLNEAWHGQPVPKYLTIGLVPLSATPNAKNYKVNFANPGQYFIPQTLFGLQSQPYGVTDGTTGAPSPRSTCWPDYLLSAWDAIMELSLCNGFLPVLSCNDDGTVNLHFKDRTNPIATYFSGPTPVGAKPESMDETEQGIQITALQSFENNRPTDGWYDDLYAMKQGHGVNSIYGVYDIEEHLSDKDAGNAGLDDTINPRMANPYTVPGTPNKPANLNTLMRFAGYTFAWYTGNLFGTYQAGRFTNVCGGQIEGVGVYPFFNLTDINGLVKSGIGQAAAWYPTLVPLIPGNPAALIIGLPNFAPAIPTLKDFTPVVRARFTFKDAGGNLVTSLSDALRQCLARFYSLLFVTSARKYSFEDGTVTQFKLIDPVTGKQTGTASWQNVALYNQRMAPDGKRYFVKRRSPNVNTMVTTMDCLRIEGNQFIGNGGNFYDGNEGVGPLAPGNPPSGGGPAPSGGKVTGG